MSRANQPVPQSLFSSVFIEPRLFIYLGVSIVLMLSGFWEPVMVDISLGSLVGIGLIMLVDFRYLYGLGRVQFERELPDRMSNGDFNPVRMTVTNEYSVPVYVTIDDPLPIQFQIRDRVLKRTLTANQSTDIRYEVRPTRRGDYIFQNTHVFVRTQLSVLSRRFIFHTAVTVPVYPSYLQMQQLAFYAFDAHRQLGGLKKVRRIGQSKEFEQIKQYVIGDDFRHVNWKATARQNQLMVNQYQDEISQDIYCVIDTGRTMKDPFNGMSMVDYSVNAALVLSYIAMRKYDRAGLIIFENEVKHRLKPSAQLSQFNLLMDALYRIDYQFKESDYERLYAMVKKQVHQRSLLVLFTHFYGLTSLERQLPYLRLLNETHLLVVVMFENTELHAAVQQSRETLEDVYITAVGESMIIEQQQMVRRLAEHGIQSVLSTPEDMSVNTINKYLELKSRGLI